MRGGLKSLFAIGVVAVGALVAAGCGGESGDSKSATTIKMDGSSTVAPLSEAVAETFMGENPDTRVTVGTSGTGGGFEKFCSGETDVSNASRAIEDDEKAMCEKNQIEYDQLQVANDGLAVVIHPDNDWAACLTVEQLKKVWDRDSQVDNWNDIDPGFPNEKLKLYGAGTDSGTFDYFTEAINGEEGRSRTDYNATEDDNVTVQGVSGSTGGLGYFGLSYAQQNESKIQTVKIDAGDGCVAPTVKSVQSGDYKPLSRPLFIYPSAKLLERKEGAAFIEFYAGNTQKLAEQALFVPLTDEQTTQLKAQIDELKG